jgi:hypothetical protein
MSSTLLLKKRLMLVAVMAVFIVPLVLAGTLYANLDWRPAGTTNSGQIIAEPLSEVAGSVVTASGKWTLLMPVPEHCGLNCRADLFKLRQVREALGKYIERIDYAVLEPGTGKALLPSDLLAEHKQMSIYSSQALWDEISGSGFADRGDVLLVDPLGNLVMRYDAGFAARGLYKDLKRVLKLSSIG